MSPCSITFFELSQPQETLQYISFTSVCQQKHSLKYFGVQKYLSITILNNISSNEPQANVSRSIPEGYTHSTKPN